MTCSSRPLSFARNWSAMVLATSLSTEKMSVSLRSKVSAQTWESLAALINCTFTPHGIAALLYAAFQNMRDAKLLCDVGQICGCALIMLGGCARDHLRISDLGQPGQNLVLDAIR